VNGRNTVRYGLVAGTCLVIHNTVVIAGDAAGLPLLLSVMLSFTVVVTVGYVLHSRVTFERSLTWGRFERYVVVAAMSIPASFVTLWFWSVALRLAMIWAAPIASLCTTLFNYLIYRWAITAPAKGLE
jgi:putative flippase GtrA